MGIDCQGGKTSSLRCLSPGLSRQGLPSLRTYLVYLGWWAVSGLARLLGSNASFLPPCRDFNEVSSYWVLVWTLHMLALRISHEEDTPFLFLLEAYGPAGERERSRQFLWGGVWKTEVTQQPWELGSAGCRKWPLRRHHKMSRLAWGRMQGAT